MNLNSEAGLLFCFKLLNIHTKVVQIATRMKKRAERILWGILTMLRHLFAFHSQTAYFLTEAGKQSYVPQLSSWKMGLIPILFRD